MLPLIVGTLPKPQVTEDDIEEVEVIMAEAEHVDVIVGETEVK